MRRHPRIAAVGFLLAAFPVVAADPPTLPGDPPLAAGGPIARPAYAAGEPMPIDLPTVLRLVNENSPAVGFARARAAQAVARQERANVAWLPTLAVGGQYFRSDGQTQDQRGLVFSVSRGNLFAGGLASVRIDTADAIYDRLIARRLTAAEVANAGQATINAQLDAALAYLDLVQVYGQMAVNADTLAKAEAMLKFARDARAAQISKTAADVNRAEAEVAVRRQERIELQGRAGAASARLARLLLLQPSVDLHPCESTVAPVELVDGDCTLDDLIRTAVATRPELAAARSLIAAQQERVRKARHGPLLPRVAVEQSIDGFGGGLNDHLSQFGARSVLTAGAYWELTNLGLGDAALVREARAGELQSLYQLSEAQARVSAEVAEAAKVAVAKYDQLMDARSAVAEAAETYRKLQDTSFNMVGPRAQYDALEPLLAIQSLDRARLSYLAAVCDFNRAQLRLFAALGNPVTPPAPVTPTPPPPAPVAPAPSPPRPTPVIRASPVGRTGPVSTVAPIPVSVGQPGRIR